MSGKLRIYKDKLEGDKKFYSIVKTIKMVTLAKYRQTQSRTKVRDMSLRYTEKCFGAEFEEDAAIKSAEKTLLYVPVTTNRGSCGALNSHLIRYMDEVIGPKTKILAIGKKGNDSMSKLFPKEYTLSIINDMKQGMHFAFASYVYEYVQTIPDVQRTQIVYNRYISAGMQRQAVFNIPAFDKWLERINEIASTDTKKEHYSFANEVVDNEEEFIKDFYDFHVTQTLTHALCENELSEYAARIVAVEGQLTNIMQLQNRTLSLYNKTRQGSITASLIEIISAMNAMNASAMKSVSRGKFWDAAKV